MADKHNGYVAQKRDNDAGHTYFYNDVEHCEDLIRHHRRKLVKATLVISDDRVYAESEVRAMVREMIMECGAFVSPAGDVNATDIADIKHIAQRHLGITLDPA